MVDNTLVSIIIPLYNAEKHIGSAIQSCINQTWKNKEIIVIDDGSTDQSYEIAKTYQSEIVQVFNQKNQGASAARNKGFSLSRGEYIQFLDADDFLSPNKIESQLSLLLVNEDKLCLCATIYFSEEEEPDISSLCHPWFSKGSDDPVDFITKLYKTNAIGTGYGGMIQPNAWLIPKKLIDQSGGWDELISVDDDGEFFCRLILGSKGIVYSYDALNFYRSHVTGKNLSADNSTKAFESRLKALDSKYRQLLLKTNSSKIASGVFASNYWELGVQSFPKNLIISKICIRKAKAFDYNGPKFIGAKKSTALSKIIGWKLTRLAMFYLFKI